MSSWGARPSASTTTGRLADDRPRVGRSRRPHHRGGPCPAGRHLLGNFWEGGVATLDEAIEEERRFELVTEDPSGALPVVVTGSINRIDCLLSGGIEVIDYKTGRMSSHKDVAESLQMSIYALACRDALGLGPRRR